MVRLSRMWKLYAFYTLVLLILMAAGGFTIQSRLKTKLNAHLREDVLILTKTLARALPDSEKPSILGPWCREYQGITDVRVTVLNREGRVIGDSTGAALSGETRLDRPEIAAALKEGTAVAVRRSDTAKGDMLYAALYAKEKKKILRLGMPMARVKMIENQVMGFLALVLFLTPVGAVVFSFLFARYLAPEERSRIRGLKTRRR